MAIRDWETVKIVKLGSQVDWLCSYAQYSDNENGMVIYAAGILCPCHCAKTMKRIEHATHVTTEGFLSTHIIIICLEMGNGK